MGDKINIQAPPAFEAPGALPDVVSVGTVKLCDVDSLLGHRIFPRFDAPQPKRHILAAMVQKSSFLHHRCDRRCLTREPALRCKLETKPYAGILAEPLPTWTRLTTPTDEEISTLLDKKLKALLEHYGINSRDAFKPGPKMAAAWANLAWRLARVHVPGFRGPPRKRGAPATRKSDDVTLVMHVELLKRRDGLSDRRAVKEIAAQHIIKGSEQTLLQRYKRTKNQFAPFAQLLDNITAVKGSDAVVQVMEKALAGDDKETFLSPA
jgi:hypothetical protein